jgi:YD repeat-containing protein
VTTERIAFDREDPAKIHFGPLTYRGGLVLRSRDTRFGGFSGLEVSDDGKRLIAVSDQGHWFTAELDYDEAGRLSGLRDGRLERLRDHRGKALKRKGRADAEALAESRDGGLIVGLEQHHNILDYAPFPEGYEGARARLPIPDDFRPRDNNSGIEAMVRLTDGRLLALVEQGEKEDLTPG